MTSTRRALLLTLLGVAYLAEAAGKQNVQQRLPLYPSEDGSIALARTATLASETCDHLFVIQLVKHIICVDSCGSFNAGLERAFFVKHTTTAKGGVVSGKLPGVAGGPDSTISYSLRRESVTIPRTILAIKE